MLSLRSGAQKLGKASVQVTIRTCVFVMNVKKTFISVALKTTLRSTYYKITALLLMYLNLR